MTKTRATENNGESTEKPDAQVIKKTYGMGNGADSHPFKLIKGFSNGDNAHRLMNERNATLTIPLLIENKEIQVIRFETSCQTLDILPEQLNVAINGFQTITYGYSRERSTKILEIIVPKGLTGDLEIHFERLERSSWYIDEKPRTPIEFKSIDLYFMPENQLLHNTDPKIQTQIQDLTNEIKQVKQKYNEKINELTSKIKTGQEIFDEALLKAAEQGDRVKIESALNLNANIQSKNKFGQTALYLSVMNGHRAASDLILSIDPSLFMEVDIHGHTPIQQLGITGQIELLDWLYEKGKSIPEFSDDPEQFDKLYNLSHQNAKRFLASKKLLNSVKNNDIEDVSDALEKGAFINTLADDGETALFKSIYSGHDEITQLLLDNDADPTIGNTHSNVLSTLEVAKKKITDDKLLSSIATSFLIHAAKNGNQADMLLALKSDANLIGVNKDGHTALHKAVLTGNTDSIKLLLKKHVEFNFDIHIPDKNDVTPYQLAKELNLKVKTKQGKKPLEIYMLEKFGSYKKENKLDFKTGLSNSPFSFVTAIGQKNENATATASQNFDPKSVVKRLGL